MEPEQEYRRATRGIGVLFAAALILLFLFLIGRQLLGRSDEPAATPPSPNSPPALTEPPPP